MFDQKSRFNLGHLDPLAHLEEVALAVLGSDSEDGDSKGSQDSRDGDSEEVALAAAQAKVYCSEAYFHCAGQSIQVHGGIGFTWEHDAHLYFKRAQSSSTLFGSPTQYREEVAQAMGLC